MATALIAAVAGIVGLLLGRFWDIALNPPGGVAISKCELSIGSLKSSMCFTRLFAPWRCWCLALLSATELSTRRATSGPAGTRLWQLWLYGPQKIARAARTVDDPLARKTRPAHWLLSATWTSLYLESAPFGSRNPAGFSDSEFI